MNTFKKYLIKRKIKKNAQKIQKDVKRAYRGFSRDLDKRISGLRLPRITVAR